jgi:hypothetical protein
MTSNDMHDIQRYPKISMDIQSHAAPHADRDSDHNSSYDSESDLEPGAGDPESGIHTYPRDILSYPQDILLHIHVIYATVYFPV